MGDSRALGNMQPSESFQAFLKSEMERIKTCRGGYLVDNIMTAEIEAAILDLDDDHPVRWTGKAYSPPPHGGIE